MVRLSLFSALLLFGALHAHEEARDYSAAVTPVQKKAIGYVIRTLGDKPEASLLIYKGRLEVEGNKADGVHPLRWFEVILTNEKLKASMANLCRRSWIFSQFMNGMGHSFDLAVQRGNLTEAQLHDFAEKIGVDVSLLQPSFDQQNWKEFVSTAVANVPRAGHHDRYDM